MMFNWFIRILNLICVLMLPLMAEAQDKAPHQAARAAIAHCPQNVKRLIPPADQIVSPLESLFTLTSGFTLTVEYSSSGNGIDGVWTESVRRINTKSCSVTSLKMEGTDGQMMAEVEYSRSDGKVVSTAERHKLVASLSRLKGVPAQPSNPAHGASRIVASGPGKCPPVFEYEPREWWDGGDNAWELSGPVHPLQPSLKGQPKASPSTLWTPQMLDALGTKSANDVLVFKLDAPRSKRRAGRYELFQLPIRGRVGGHAVAIYDHQTKTHRWTLVSRNCVFGDIQWLGGNKRVQVGVARCQHPAFERGYIPFVVDLAMGTTHLIYFNPEYTFPTSFTATKNSLQRWSSSKERLSPVRFDELLTRLAERRAKKAGPGSRIQID